MPYIFSTSQIDRCHHLLTEHNCDVNQVADIMDTTIRNAHQLIRMVKQRYSDKYVRPRPSEKFNLEKRKVYIKDSKKEDHVKVKPIAFTRPKAEYSNQRLYDLI